VALPQREDPMSYYKEIDGKRYDAALLEAAETRV
jgi:hypothetical protein